MLKILQLSTFDRKGGAEQIAWNLFEAYARLGHRSWLAVGEKMSSHPDVFQIPHDPYGNTWKRWCIDTAAWLDARFEAAFRLGVRLDNYAHDLKSLVKLREELDFEQGRENFEYYGSHRLLELPPERPDVVHGHNLHTQYFDLRYLARLSQTLPVVLTLHDAWLATGHCAHSFDCERWRTGCGGCPDLEIYPAIEADNTAENWTRKKQIYQQSRLYVASPGKWLLERMQQSMLSPGVVEWRHIPNGVQTDFFRPADKRQVRAELGISQNARVLMFAGNFLKGNPFKDMRTLRGALQIIGLNPEAKDLILLAVGDEGETEQVGKATLRYVPFVKEPREMARYYQAADLYVHAARIDTFPNTVLEALACGTPVVASRVGGIPEQIRALRCDRPWDAGELFSAEEGTGILVPREQPRAMAEAIEFLLAHPEVMGRMSHNAMEDVQRRFTLERQTAAYLSWYEEILAAGRS